MGMLAAAFGLLLAAGLFGYRWHTHRNPRVVTVKRTFADGSFHTAASGVLRSPASSVAPGSVLDGRDGSSSSLVAMGVRPGGHPRQGHSSTGSPDNSRPLLGHSNRRSVKSRIVESVSSVGAAGGGGFITHVSVGASGSARSWMGPSSLATGSSDTTKIPRGSPARCSGTDTGTSKTSSKGASVADSRGSGSEAAALECVRAEVHAAVQQLQVRSQQAV